MADDKAPVVVMDANGTQHQFPAGFDETRAHQIVWDQSSPVEKLKLAGQWAAKVITGLAPVSGGPSAVDHPVATMAAYAVPAALGSPALANAATEMATSPAVPRAVATLGRVIGGTAPIVVGASEGGPVGALVGVGAAAKGAYYGGRAGWFTGKLAQNMAAPVANVLEKAAANAPAVAATVGAVRGAYDAAAVSADLAALHAKVKDGAAPSTAAMQLAAGDPSRFSTLMTAYMKNRQIGAK